MSVTPHSTPAGARDEYLAQVDALLAELGIPVSAFAHRNLPLCYEPAELIVAERTTEGREHWLTPETTVAWRQLAAAARGDGVELHIVSAFRNLQRQADIIRRKQRLGIALEQILTASAPPGYSEHHTGRAIDINTPGCRATEEEFERTRAYEWLTRHAASFGFALSFPRGNKYGYIFEPWHWCFAE